MRECFEVNGKIFFSREEAEKYEKEQLKRKKLEKRLDELTNEMVDILTKFYEVIE